MAKRGRQANLSFFAFTATPKHKTLAVFGRDGEPIHRYTMRQAIEEGFILDVLKNYTTYATYFKLLKACEDDPNVERKKAAQALARFMRLHPHNIAQKTEVMVEHFQAVTRHKIGGRAKAMVVTGSRLEAVRYKQSFDRYIQEKGYPIKTLVAFSGTVQDDKLAGRDLHRRGDEPRHPREGTAGEVRHAGVPGAAGGGEVPDRLRPAAAAHDVRGQAAGRHPGRADALAPEPHPSAQGRHLRSRLRQRPRGDPGGVQDLLRRRGDGRGSRSQRACTQIKARAGCLGHLSRRGSRAVLRGLLQAEAAAERAGSSGDERGARSGRVALHGAPEGERGGSRALARQTAGLSQPLRLPEPDHSLPGLRPRAAVRLPAPSGRETAAAQQRARVPVR